MARIDRQGTIHLVADDRDGPWYCRSVDGGASFSRPLPVVDAAARKPRLEYQSFDMAVDITGRVHVAMSNNAWKLKLPLDERGFFYTSLAADAKEFSPVRIINAKPSEGFSLATDGNDTVTACWLAGKLYANISRDGGATFGPNTEIDSTFDPCNCCTTAAAYGADGTLAILYREETNNDRDMYVVLWNQKRGEISHKRVSTTLWNVDACPMTYYSITQSPQGYVAAWPTRSDVYFARLDEHGQLLSPGEIKTPGTSGIRTGVLALAADDGATLIAWKKDNRLGWQLYDPQGRAAGQPGSVDSPGNGAAGVVDRRGRFILFP